LRQDNSMFRMLERVPNQATWTNFVSRKTFSLIDSAGRDCGLRCRALSLGSHFPPYVDESRRASLNPQQSSLGLMVESPSRKRLAFMPAVPQITAELLKEFASADVLLFDGTFWSDDELIRTQGSGQTARQMGHVPVSSHEGSLELLAQLRRPRKIYVHINNTNPMLKEAGQEYQQVRSAGWEVAEDGWQFDL
jgi:pyrroloquinoline quinone biosynthesis protein B